MKLLTIETTCDETAAAVVTDQLEVLSSVVATQEPLAVIPVGFPRRNGRHRSFPDVATETTATAAPVSLVEMT